MSYTKGTPSIITKGLICIFDFQNLNYYKPSTYYSLVGSNKATTINSPNIDKNNNLILDGLNQYLDLGTISQNNPLLFANSFNQTLDVWVNLKGQGKDYQRIIDKSNGNNALNGYSLMYSPSTQKIYYVLNDGVNQTLMGCNFNLYNQWVNIVIIKDSTQYKMYINKKLSQQNTGILNFSKTTTNMRIGAYTQSTEKCFQGSINSIKIYDRALSPQEVLLNYEALKGRFK